MYVNSSNNDGSSAFTYLDHGFVRVHKFNGSMDSGYAFL